MFGFGAEIVVLIGGDVGAGSGVNGSSEVDGEYILGWE